MTDYTIPMIIGMTLAFALGAGFGALWGLSRHEWLYCRVTAHLTWRMREAMRSLGIEEWQIDKALEYMGSVVIPPHIPMPEPQVKAASERLRQGAVHDGRGGAPAVTARRPGRRVVLHQPTAQDSVAHRHGGRGGLDSPQGGSRYAGAHHQQGSRNLQARDRRATGKDLSYPAKRDCGVSQRAD